MEVHHHGHVHEKKKWKEYLFQFLMLFLAVFCGFLAEYQLEHKIERDREKVYIQSLIEDLVTDTSNLSDVIKQFDAKELHMDTVLRMYGKLTKGYNDTLWRNLQKILGFPDFIYTDRTMQQLKNSGAMRLIRNKSAADGITDYDLKVRDLDGIDVPDLDKIHFSLRNLWYELIDVDDLENDIQSKTRVENGNKNYLLKSDRASIGKFNNNIRDFKYVIALVKTKEVDLKEKAIQLITLLKKEYHLK